MRTPKYQQYFHCFFARTLGPYEFWFSFQQNIVTILISAIFRGVALIKREALIRGKRLLNYGYSKVRHLLEGDAYLNPGAYYRKYGTEPQELLSGIAKNNKHNQHVIYSWDLTATLEQQVKPLPNLFLITCYEATFRGS